mgnify:CR=1 FL=1
MRSSLVMYSPDDIKVGDIISTHNYRAQNPYWVLTRLVYTVITGDLFLHTVLVVNYQGKKYVLNSYRESEISLYRKDRGFIPVIRKNSWMSFLEPLESFIHYTEQEGSVIRVLSTENNIEYSEDICQKIENNSQKLVHCAYFCGKYLEEIGVMKNKSLLNDSLYYAPINFTFEFPKMKYFRLE